MRLIIGLNLTDSFFSDLNLDIEVQVAEWVLDRTKLLKWLLARLRPREFDSNKQYTSELLAILIQTSPKNQQRLADMNGIDAILQVHLRLELFLQHYYTATCDLLIYCTVTYKATYKDTQNK